MLMLSLLLVNTATLSYNNQKLVIIAIIIMIIITIGIIKEIITITLSITLEE